MGHQNVESQNLVGQPFKKVSQPSKPLTQQVTRLKTLGTLELEGSSFCRTLPLMLLSYLSLEGPKDRRHLAELFWPSASDSLNCLSVTLSRLRRSAAGAMGSDDTRVWACVPSDAQQVLDAFEAGKLAEGLALYEGCFLDSFYLRTESPEFEEWVYHSREFLAYSARNALLEHASSLASCGQFRRASKSAEKAYFLKGAPALGPSSLEKLYRLMAAGASFHTFKVRKEAASYDLPLTTSMQEARESLLTQSALFEAPVPYFDATSYRAA